MYNFGKHKTMQTLGFMTDRIYDLTFDFLHSGMGNKMQIHFQTKFITTTFVILTAQLLATFRGTFVTNIANTGFEFTNHLVCKDD